MVLALDDDQQRRPNFVFYFPDTIRAESVGTYGSFLEKLTSDLTPNIDSFAKESVTFEQCHVRSINLHHTVSRKRYHSSSYSNTKSNHLT